MKTPLRPGRSGWILAILGVAAIGAGSLALVSAAPRLPALIAVHWGLGGIPDRWEPLPAVLWGYGALIGGTTVLLLLLTAWLANPLKHLVAALGSGLIALLGVVLYGTALAQVGGSVTVRPGLWVTLALIAGLVVGGLVGLLARPPRDPATPVQRGPGLDAPRAPLSETGRIAWIGRLGPGPLGQGLILAGLAAAGVALALLIDPWLMSLPVLLAAVALAFSAAVATIDGHGVRVRSLGSLNLADIPLSSVREARVIEVKPLRDFGGWGWRMALSGRQGFITRSGVALEIERLDAPALVLTVDDAEGAASVLNALKLRALAS